MAEQEQSKDLFTFILDSGFNLTLNLDVFAILALLAIFLVVMIVYRTIFAKWHLTSLEIDQAEFGIGDQKFVLKPNIVDRQIAYQIWVELSTRKIGLEIDLNDDVVSEIYDSWYSFFSVTRDLLKNIPVSKFKRSDTEKIIGLSIDILNDGLRPHLTRWQSRFRTWYERASNNEKNLELSPQEIQERFPEFQDLKEDLLKTNRHLINYRKSMHKIISGT